MKDLVPDDELWWRVAESITPLQHRRRTPSLKPPAKAEQGEAAAPRKARAMPAPKPAPAHKPTLAELTHDRLSDLDKRTGQKLVRGKLPLEGRIDLHGMTQEQAHRHLARFIETSAEVGKRCVLVITGKGTKASGEVGVLRAAVPRWLNGSDLRPLVLAIRYAQAKDGGEGALYVLLKRRRDSR
ncbi:MAG TPA: Smr/MutS family protein [Alphaproteobacteria bacterium]|nr:Smr/MutS family protein [Alphaproteobacteria bacterium]